MFNPWFPSLHFALNTRDNAPFYPEQTQCWDLAVDCMRRHVGCDDYDVTSAKALI